MDLTKELRIGKFKVVRRLGRGGMGAVYEAFDTSLHRRVAIKTLLAQELAGDESRRRFEREARETSLLRSPHTVQVFDFGVTQKGDLYYVMEHLEGKTLWQLPRQSYTTMIRLLHTWTIIISKPPGPGPDHHSTLWLGMSKPIRESAYI